ncbi:FxsA family protein [Hansschlegelia plantiphila]|uniref:FxsA family protein n=1 Tax=Hansschlegelia plantiphila TaxID=374655 RepID=A0A9W6J3D1_9HYPH|nr:FxsA family protein [Hansschlegelia plantiphila]GLK68603.1 hypothetical protein GCM10008179_22410 [Hansschlegelia plantiphila]
MPRILGLILILPVLELLAFVGVASAIGLGKAVLLQLAISLIGVAMISSLLTEAKTRVRGGGVMSFALDKSHSMRGLAGLLFAVPGFLTDALGVLALVPEFRTRLRRLLGGQPVTARTPGRRAAPADLIELDRREWREAPPGGEA